MARVLCRNLRTRCKGTSYEPSPARLSNGWQTSKIPKGRRARWIILIKMMRTKRTNAKMACVLCRNLRTRCKGTNYEPSPARLSNGWQTSKIPKEDEDQKNERQNGLRLVS
ncbi:8939_t:CDS:2, partial [Funneliformis geosporum]